MNEDFQIVVMELVVNAGDGRSMAIQAIREARAGNFEKAEQLIQDCEEALVRCHQAQTNLIQAEIQGEPVQLSLLMVHAQDHLMNAMTVKDLAREMIEILKEKAEV